MRAFKVEWKQKQGEKYEGDHILSCYLYHSPLPDDYSHVQIDILHEIDSVNPILNDEKRYTRDNWNKGYNLLKKKLKDLREEYKFRLANAFSEYQFTAFEPSQDFLDDNPILKKEFEKKL